MKKIGFIGLGVMGEAMAKNLLTAGYPLTVWNRTRSKMQPLIALGATPARSPKEVAEQSDVVITMVSDSPDVEEVVLGPSGVIEGVRTGMVVVDMSSISPLSTNRIADVLAARGVSMLDAPVSGGDIGAMEATLSIMVGGDRTVYDGCLPIFQALGTSITYMGGTGSGQATKLCNQVICGLHIQAVAEGLMLGSKLGLDLDRLLQVVTAGYAQSRILAHLGPKMVQHDLRPGFKMCHQQKDLKNALRSAASVHLPLPGTALVHQLFRSVEAEGLGEEGTQTAILVLEKLAGPEQP
jgi:3-hydroxyisobutyrate dehydrogenase